MAKKTSPTPQAGGPDINDDAEYTVTLKRPIQVARGTWARVGMPLTMKGRKLRQHIEDIDGFSEVAS